MELLLVVFLLAAIAAAAETITAVKQGCQTSCGGVDIPYPFGIGPECARNGFELSCVNNGSAGPIAVLSGTPIQVTRLTVEPAESQVMLPVGWQCYNTSDPKNAQNWSYATTEMNRNGVYRISNTHNMLVVLGCNTLGYTESLRSEGGSYSRTYYTGCMSYCNNSASAQDGQCAGVGCCHVDIPPGLTDNSVTFRVYDHTGMMDYSPCDYTFLIDRTNYTFQRADLKMDKNRTVPVWLDWAIRDNGSMSCAEAKDKAGYACVSAHSECINSTNGPGYNCKCSTGYEGNAYVHDGCTNINECEWPNSNKYPCYGVCLDTDGSYECRCHRGYQNSGDPKEQACSPKFPLAAQLALGITFGISFLMVALLFTLMMIQKRRLNEHFRKNGGSVLQKVENIKIFTKDELKKITKNNSEVLGQGGFGKVYKGNLEDNTMVAVKASIEVNDARKEDFTNEVIIQSQMIHTNIIKLLGCCLEVDVPMLVYEFAANGNLQDILHGDNNHHIPLPLDLRLDIAVESAEGLRYMHSSTNRTIRHGDVKPANILLNDKFNPKISDFGTSKLLTVDKDFTMFVVGSMGYIDPVFHKTGRLTQKSDVYSFGVVLLELITRKPTIYNGNCSLLIDFQKVYETENSGRAMFDKEIATEENIFILEEIGRLAMECLKEKVEERPDMKKVAEQLMILRRARKGRQGNYNISPQRFEEISVEGTPLSLGTGISGNSGATLSAPSTPAYNEISNL